MRPLKMQGKTSKSPSYAQLVGGIAQILENARHQAVHAVNKALASAYWDVGRQIVEFEQRGKVRAAYGEGLLKRLSIDLSQRMGRGFSERNLEQMRLFYLQKPISQTASAKSASPLFPLSWSQKVLLEVSGSVADFRAIEPKG